MNAVVDDKEIGRLIIRTHPRARKIVFRTKSDAVYVSVPPGISLKEINQAVEELRGRLVIARRQISRPSIDLDYKIDTYFFQLSLVSGDTDCFFANLKPGYMEIVCPRETDFANEKLQHWLRKVIEESLKKNARNILPLRLDRLARQNGLSYGNVRIGSSRGRWGSCSANKGINLSCFLLLLPVHLVDYVLLHELCHTREMNHGDLFWRLLNELTEGKAFSLREELKQYRAEV